MDPGVFYVSTLLACAQYARGVTDYVPGTRGPTGDLVSVAREDFGASLLPTDILERAGYPAGEQEAVRLVREGQVFAFRTYTPDGFGAWFRDFDATC